MMSGGSRRLAAGVLAGVLGCVAMLAGGPPVADAAPKTITSQSYVKVVQLDRIKEAGWDGTGVTIAIIDGPPDLSVPELAGADVTVYNDCKTKPPLEDILHGTAVLSILANKDWGWAPKAKFLVYASYSDEGITPEEWSKNTSQCSNPDRFMEKAMNDGADIISMSIGTPWASAPTWPLARAIATGVPLVFGAGNEGEKMTDASSALTKVSPPSDANGVVSVGADNLDGSRASFSSWGTGLTIMAPGVDIKARAADSSGKLTQIGTTRGTSMATPMVAGALALAKQKWPDANGNQLIHSLIDTAVRDWDGWNPGMGYGNFNPWKLLNNDPSKYSTDNPLMDKEKPDTRFPSLDQYPGQHGRAVSQEAVDLWRDGLADPLTVIYIMGDREYVYRGPDTQYVGDPDFPAAQMQPGTATRAPSPSLTSSSPSAVTPTPTPAPTGPAPLSTGLIVAVVCAGVVIAATITVTLIVAHRRRPGRTTGKEPDGQGL